MGTMTVTDIAMHEMCNKPVEVKHVSELPVYTDTVYLEPAKDPQPAVGKRYTTFAGPSLQATKAYNAGKLPEGEESMVKPTKVVEEQLVARTTRKGFLERRRVRRAEVKVDLELLGWLRLEYAFRERTTDLFAQMAAKARQHLKLYDTTHLTALEVHEMIVRVVALAYEVPECEADVRQRMRNPDVIEEINKSGKFLKKGIVGNSLFGKAVTLPTK